MNFSAWITIVGATITSVTPIPHYQVNWVSFPFPEKNSKWGQQTLSDMRGAGAEVYMEAATISPATCPRIPKTSPNNACPHVTSTLTTSNEYFTHIIKIY